MHRVLSYQTAMRASTGRDVREYVTKRTCVSLILSIAFFTLISGFLLGKFVADRQHHIKNLRDSELRFVRDLHQVRDNLLQAIKNMTRQPPGEERAIETLHNQLFTKFVSCMESSFVPNYKTSTHVFVEQMIDRQNMQEVQCLAVLITLVEASTAPSTTTATN